MLTSEWTYMRNDWQNEIFEQMMFNRGLVVWVAICWKKKKQQNAMGGNEK